jgi:ankyrin repeat protein
VKTTSIIKAITSGRIPRVIMPMILILYLLTGSSCSTLANALLKAGDSVIGKVDSAGDYALVFVQHNNLEWMKEMVEDYGLDVNEKVLLNGKTGKCAPLYLVNYEYQDVPFSKYLLEKGADPNIAYGDTTILSQIDKFELIKLLVEYGADINLQDSSGNSAIDYAVDFRTIKFYIQNGAKISQKSLQRIHDSEINAGIYQEARLLFTTASEQGLKFNDDPIFEAAVLGDTNRFIELYNLPTDIGDSVQDKNNPNLPFYVTAFCGSEALELLLKNGFTIDSTDKDGHDLLWIAANSGNVDVIKYLVENGANLNFNTYDPGSEDPLKSAIYYGYHDAVKYMLEKGAQFNINEVTGYDGDGAGWDANYGLSPTSSIQAAAMNGDTKMLDILQEYGYPFNENTYYVGLEFAIAFQQFDVLNYFLEKGADPNYVDNRNGDEESLLVVCARFGDAESAEILRKHGIVIGTSESDALTEAVDYGNYELAEYLLQNGMDVNSRKKYEDGSIGASAWEEAEQRGYFDMVKLLVDHGVNVNDQDVAFLACEGGGSSRIINYLLEHGADINSKDSYGDTALSNAVSSHYSDKEYEGLAKHDLDNVKLLLELGADVTIANDKGKTALDIAKENKDKEVIKLLEEQ